MNSEISILIGELVSIEKGTYAPDSGVVLRVMAKSVEVRLASTHRPVTIRKTSIRKKKEHRAMEASGVDIVLELLTGMSLSTEDKIKIIKLVTTCMDNEEE